MSIATEHSPRPRLMAIVGAIWLLAFYALCRPYRGVRHDAELYFAQAQLHLTPEWMSRDLFFIYGSQDRYSIFSTLFAPILHTFGLQQSEMGALLVLHALFWFSAWLLVREASGPTRWGMLAVAAVLPHYYGALQIFSFTEPFLTARTLAEPACLLALVAMQKERKGWATAALVFAGLAHPLIALPAWIIFWYLLCEQDWRWAWASLAIPAGALAGVMGIAPFDGMFKTFDADWWKHVSESNAFDLYSNWRLVDVAQALFDVAVLAVAVLLPRQPLARIYRASLVSSFVLCALSVICVDWLHLILPTQLQLWRSLWIVHLLALLALLPCAQALWAKGPTGRLAAAMLVLATIVLATATPTSIVFGIAAVGVTVMALRGAAVSPALARLGVGACVVGAVLMGVNEAALKLMMVAQHALAGMALARMSSIPTSIAQIMLAIAWLGIVVAARARWRLALPLSALVGVCALVLGVSQWDQRDRWTRYVETHYSEPHPFEAYIPATAQVYWPGDLMDTWALLHRPAYASVGQAAAVVFQRPLAFELQRRVEVVDPMRIQTVACTALAMAGRANFTVDQCQYTDIGIRDVCLAKGGPDFVVLLNSLAKPPLATWSFRNERGVDDPYYLYGCHQFTGGSRSEDSGVKSPAAAPSASASAQTSAS